MAPQPGEMVHPPLDKPTTPVPGPVSESCGQKLLEILNKNDKSDPLLCLLDSPKLFNGQIWKFVNYTEQEIRSWEAETPTPRKSMKTVHTNPVSSRGEKAEPLKGNVPPMTAHHSPEHYSTSAPKSCHSTPMTHDAKSRSTTDWRCENKVRKM